MLSDSGDRRQAASHKTGGAPPENEILPCPRCESSNTKFCYYNNYNLSQPRHFCKSCRRYWTQGGTLRNIPVGGGSRKNAKRSRTSSTVSSPENSHTPPISATPVSVHSSSVTSEKTDSSALPLRFHDVDLNVSNVSGPFTSLLSTQGQGPPGGFLALGGFGLGLGSGFEEMGFELGRGVWPLEDVSEPGGGCGGGGSGGVSGEPWHIGGGGGGHDHGGFSDGDCFSWPELAISTTVRGEKAA